MFSSAGYNRKQVAANRLFPVNDPIIIGLFKSAFNGTVFIPPSIHTYFVVAWQGRCHPPEFLAVNVPPIFFYFFDGIGSKIGLDLFIYIFNDPKLAIFERSARISFFTTTALTLREITNELFFHYLITDQHIINNYHGSIFSKVT